MGIIPARQRTLQVFLGPKELGFLVHKRNKSRGLVTHHSLLADQVHCGSLQSTALLHPHTRHLQARERAWSGDAAVSAFVLAVKCTLPRGPDHIYTGPRYEISELSPASACHPESTSRLWLHMNVFDYSLGQGPSWSFCFDDCSTWDTNIWMFVKGKKKQNCVFSLTKRKGQLGQFFLDNQM